MLIIYADNTVSLDGRYVGRVHKADAQPMRKPRPVRFYTASGPVSVTGYDVEHQIDAPLYVGGPSNWRIGDDFEAAVRSIVAA